eukprot:351570-Chlamydomonas_euryale.AAC.6
MLTLRAWSCSPFPAASPGSPDPARPAPAPAPKPGLAPLARTHPILPRGFGAACLPCAASRCAALRSPVAATPSGSASRQTRGAGPRHCRRKASPGHRATTKATPWKAGGAEDVRREAGERSSTTAPRYAAVNPRSVRWANRAPELHARTPACHEATHTADSFTPAVMHPGAASLTMEDDELAAPRRLKRCAHVCAHAAPATPACSSSSSHATRNSRSQQDDGSRHGWSGQVCSCQLFLSFRKSGIRLEDWQHSHEERAQLGHVIKKTQLKPHTEHAHVAHPICTPQVT